MKADRPMNLVVTLTLSLLATPAAFAGQAKTCPELQKDFAEVAAACDRAAGVTVSIDGSTTLTVPGPTTLFGGVTPPTGYMVEVSDNTAGGNYCWVNDNGPAAQNIGFAIGVNSGMAFITPSGYKPLGPVSIWCSPGIFVPPSNVPALIQVEARAY